MLAKSIISDVVPVLKTSDTGTKALTWMEVYKISHLPIVNNQELLGLISDKDIYDLNMTEEAIGNHSLSLLTSYVTEDQHIFEVIEVMANQKLSVIPVLGEKNKYLGIITLQDLLQRFSEITAVNNPGGIIVLEMNQNDYSLSEISQIIESNDVKILSLYINNVPDTIRLNLTIKLNTANLSAVIKTFERYDYEIKAVFSKDTELDDMLMDRFDSFMNYLSM